MLSAFQIFKMLMGVVVFIFVIIFFFRVSNMYVGVEERADDFEILRGFDRSVRQTFTSGNPGTFVNFRFLDSLYYDPPRLKSRNQKTLTVTTFLIASTFESNLIKECEEYEWFSFCWVYAYPQNFTLIFTPLDGDGRKDLIKDIVEVMPGDIRFAHCNDTDLLRGDRNAFLAFVDNGMDDITYTPCTVSIPDGYRLVTITTDESIEPRRNEIVLNPQTGAYIEYLSGLPELVNAPSPIRTGSYEDARDVYFLLTTGKSALDYKNEMFLNDLTIAAKIMEERMKLVKRKMLDLNVQQCVECPTPFPKECGYTNALGDEFTSDLYDAMAGPSGSLRQLNDVISANDDYLTALARTAADYKELIAGGCE
ncbi:MAG: hypothetical protein JSV63_04395 [Candidatus Aenigmatarchaeota archaeon]|nr:MAG: hypothetical protein JSV63_04395 [Candidatus Aenigmarchaeota archaeon]